MKFLSLIVLSFFITVSDSNAQTSEFERGYQAGQASCGSDNGNRNCENAAARTEAAFNDCMPGTYTTRLQCIQLAYRKGALRQCPELSGICMDNCLPGTVTTRAQCVEACY